MTGHIYSSSRKNNVQKNFFWYTFDRLWINYNKNLYRKYKKFPKISVKILRTDHYNVEMEWLTKDFDIRDQYSSLWHPLSPSYAKRCTIVPFDYRLTLTKSGRDVKRKPRNQKNWILKLRLNF